MDWLGALPVGTICGEIRLVGRCSQDTSRGPAVTDPTLGDDVLRVDARRIGKVDASVVIWPATCCAAAARGIGLAAPPVGVHKQLLVIDLDPENASTPPLVLINPEIVSASASVDSYEGCLSIPGVYLDVVRPSAVH